MSNLVNRLLHHAEIIRHSCHAAMSEIMAYNEGGGEPRLDDTMFAEILGVVTELIESIEKPEEKS